MGSQSDILSRHIRILWVRPIHHGPGKLAGEKVRPSTISRISWPWEKCPRKFATRRIPAGRIRASPTGLGLADVHTRHLGIRLSAPTRCQSTINELARAPREERTAGIRGPCHDEHIAYISGPGPHFLPTGHPAPPPLGASVASLPVHLPTPGSKISYRQRRGRTSRGLRCGDTGDAAQRCLRTTTNRIGRGSPSLVTGPGRTMYIEELPPTRHPTLYKSAKRSGNDCKSVS